MQTVSCVSRCWKTASFDSGFTSIKLCLRFTLMPLSEVNVWNQTFPDQFSINSPVSKTCIMWNYLPLTTSQSASAYFFTPNKTGAQSGLKAKHGWKFTLGIGHLEEQCGIGCWPGLLLSWRSPLLCTWSFAEHLLNFIDENLSIENM